MSFETENFFAEFERFYKQNEHKYKDIEEAMDNFVQIYNEQLNEEIFIENMDARSESMMIFEDTIQMAESELDFIKGMQQAIDVWPNNIDAKLALIHANAENMPEQLLQSEQLLKEETARWKNETDQMGWLAFEERPFFRLKYTIAVDYFEHFMYRHAAAHFNEILEINESDNLGARYYLAAIYVLLAEWEQLDELYNQFPYSNNEVFLVFPKLIAALLNGQNQLASELFNHLLDINDYIEDFLDGDIIPFEDIFKVKEFESFQINSYEELCLAASYLLPLLSSSTYLFDWMKMKIEDSARSINIDIYPSLIKNSASLKKKQNIITQNFSSNKEHVVNTMPDKTIDFFSAMNQPIFNGINLQIFRTLYHRGLKTAKDFTKKTEKQVLAINGVGPVTIKRLKENGVIFKKPKS